MSAGQRLFVKVTRDSLPQVKDKYPFLYLERGRLEIDDSSIKWIDADNNVVPLPVATLNALLLGPGTTVTRGIGQLLDLLGGGGQPAVLCGRLSADR